MNDSTRASRWSGAITPSSPMSEAWVGVPDEPTTDTAASSSDVESTVMLTTSPPVKRNRKKSTAAPLLTGAAVTDRYCTGRQEPAKLLAAEGVLFGSVSRVRPPGPAAGAGVPGAFSSV